MTAQFAVVRLGLARFRSHGAARLEFDARSVAIFGPNGAGKTNLIEAVSLLSPGRGLRGAGADELATAGDPGGWRIRAAVETPDGLQEIVTGGAGGGRSVEVDGKAASQARLADVFRILWLTPAMDRIWMDAAGERRRFLDRVTLSLIPGHAEAATSYDRALRERNRLLREQSRDGAWFEALEAQMARWGARVTANRRAALAALAAVPSAPGFPAAALTLEREGPDVEQELAVALRAGRGRDGAAGRSLTGPHRDELGAVYAEKGMQARLCSTGEQKAMLISLILANAAAVAREAGAAPVLLLDEVAAHLDENRRAALYDAIAALGAQAWMTGTGPELFAALGDRAQRLRVTETGGASRIEAG